MSSNAPPSKAALRQLRLLIQRHPLRNPAPCRQLSTVRIPCRRDSATRTSKTATTPFATQSSRVQQRPFSSTSQTPVANSSEPTLSAINDNAADHTSNPNNPNNAQSLNLANHYTLFPETLPSGAPPNAPFSIPLPSLRREFLRLQSVYHPDKLGSSSEKLRAEVISATINNAYKTLADPLLRAQYLLLDFHGIDVLAEDQGTAHSKQDPETLMEVMEAQEAIEEAQSEGEIERLKDENKVRIEKAIGKLGEAFGSGEIEEARRECIRLRFWRSLQDGLDSWEPGKEVRLIH